MTDDPDLLSADAAAAQARIDAHRVYGPAAEEPTESDYRAVAEWKRWYKENGEKR